MAYRILIVEDEPNIREFVSVGLTMEGYKVLAAKDGQEGVDMARAAKPDMIVMDVNMPRKTGWQALEEMKSTPEIKQIPVLMLTGEGAVKDVDKAMELGAASYLVKPFDLDRLLKKISIILNKSQNGA